MEMHVLMLYTVSTCMLIDLPFLLMILLYDGRLLSFIRSSLHAAEHLYSQVQDTAVKLSNLAKDHLHRLETCNQRHLLEIQMSKVCALYR